MKIEHYYAVIMAGGGGTRLWPLSRHDSPKQTLPIFEGKSLFQLAVERLQGYLPVNQIYVVTSADLMEQLHAQVPELLTSNFLIEPQPRGTAAVVALAAATILERDPNGVLAVLTADHLMPDKAEFQACLQAAAELAEQGYIVTMGIKPASPATGYGYIERGAELGVYSGRVGYEVLKFIEKPHQSKANELIKQERYSWNSGMFICQAQVVLGEFERYMPELYTVIQSLQPFLASDHLAAPFAVKWLKIQPETIDYGIMEKTSLAAVLPLSTLEWIDVGSWDSFFEVFKPDENGNIILGVKYEGIDTADSLILSTDTQRPVVTMGMKNMIVIQAPDVLMICPRGESQRVKELVNYLKTSDYTLIL